MAYYTNMTTLIQLNSHCWDCINSIRAALNRKYGVTSVIVDSTYDTVKVTGKADPRDILSVVQSYDIHARLVWTKPTPSYHQYGYSSYGYGYDNQYCCSQPSYYQPYYGSQHQSGCNIM